MKTIRAINHDIEDLSLLESMVDVYGEIALERMNRVRQGVLYSRWFLQQLESIFAQARSEYEKRLKMEAQHIGRGKQKKMTVLSHNGLTVAVLIAAKSRLYGDIIRKTYDLFIEDVKKGSEATIIGSVGASMFKEEMGAKPFTEFDLPDDRIDPVQFTDILKHLVQYEEIHVYYGKFKNVITQEPSVYKVSATSIGKPGQSDPEPYLFEPSLEAVLAFFEKEIFATLLDQVVRESQLAKYASRMVAMDRATQSVGIELKKTKIQRGKLKQMLTGKKQITAMIPVVASFNNGQIGS